MKVYLKRGIYQGGRTRLAVIDRRSLKIDYKQSYIISEDGTDIPDKSAEELIAQNKKILSAKPWPAAKVQRPEGANNITSESKLDIAEGLKVIAEAHGDIDSMKREKLVNLIKLLGITKVKGNAKTVDIIEAIKEKVEELTGDAE
jgi:hypothetical protein